MSKRWIVLLVVSVLLAVANVISAQDNPPILTQIEHSTASAAPPSPGQFVSCVGTAYAVINNDDVRPRIRVSGWRSGNTAQNLSWQVEDLDGAWSFSGAASSFMAWGETFTLKWGGSFWYWWGPFQMKANGAWMSCTP